MDFIPLNVLSVYDFLQTALRPAEYILGLKSFKYQGGGIADNNHIRSYAEYQNLFDKEDLKFIPGIRINFLNEEDQHFTLLLYIQNLRGYKSVLKLLNLHKDIYVMKDLKILTDVAAILVTNSSFFYSKELDDSSLSFMKKMVDIFPSFYLGIEIYSEPEKDLANMIREYASKHSLKTIAIPQVLYISKKKANRFEILTALSRKCSIDEARVFNPVNYLLSPDALKAIYTDEEITNTKVLADSCNFSFYDLKGQVLKLYADEKDSDNKLKELTFKSLNEHQFGQEYVDRLNYELSVISKMHFSDYFLIVKDYVDYAKSVDIKVGPGRGSAASSLVSYLLGITVIDPLKYGLIFERFLNPSRVSMPDIDIDFEDTKREKIIDYLRIKYGENRIKNIITYSSFQAASSINAIGEVFNVPNERIKKLTQNLIPSKSLEFSKVNSYNIQQILKDSYYLDIYNKAEEIEGFINNTSKHPSGVIASNLPLEDDILCQEDVLSYEFPYLEKMGFLKLDILGLSNLSFIRQIEEEMIKDGEKPLEFDKLPLDDPKVYETLNQLATYGIFQLESFGMQKAIKEVKPVCFADLYALIALYRPGPMDSIEAYAKNKNQSFEQKNAVELQKILKETYGVIIYQEQILSIIKDYASLDGSIADNFRRAIAKKDEKKMQEYHAIFVENALKNGKNKKEIDNVYKLIEKFASYGFNKAHSVSYAYITFILLYYKTYHPKAFYQSVLARENLSFSLIASLKNELSAKHLSLISPKIGLCEEKVTIKDNQFLFPFSVIKGISDETIKNIKDIKKEDFKDLCSLFKDPRIYSIDQKDISKLIDAGAFDLYESNREMIRNNLEKLSYLSMLEEGNEISLTPCKENKIKDYILQSQALGVPLTAPLRSLIKTQSIDDRNLYVLLSALNFTSTEFKAINDYKEITLSFSQPVKLSKNAIIHIEGRLSRNRKRIFVDKYEEVL